MSSIHVYEAGVYICEGEENNINEGGLHICMKEEYMHIYTHTYTRIHPRLEIHIGRCGWGRIVYPPRDPLPPPPSPPTPSGGWR
jgi:hypothetical protein